MIGKTREELSAEIEGELSGVIACYEQLVEQSDKFADAILYKEGWILGKIMPKSMSERRDTDRIVNWFNEVKEEVLDRLEEFQESILKEQKRNDLIKSLKLTKEQKSILFDE